MKRLDIREEIELISEQTVKQMAEDGDSQMLAYHIDSTDINKFVDAQDILLARDEYVEDNGDDYESPEEAEAFFWSCASVSTMDSYVKSVITCAQDYNCIEMVAVVKEGGYALLYPEQLESARDDRDRLEYYLTTALPHAAEQVLFYWKNGWDSVEKRGETDADRIDEAVSSDIFADDDWDWWEREKIGDEHQGICYDSAFYRLGWYVPGADNPAYC